MNDYTRMDPPGQRLEESPRQPDPNFTLTGDEARLLMRALATSTTSSPSAMTIQLYHRLSEISNVQPPQQQ